VSKTSKETVNQKPVSVKRLIQIPPNCLHVVVGEHNVLVSRLLLKLPLPPFEEIKHLLERCLQDDVDLFMSGFQSFTLDFFTLEWYTFQNHETTAIPCINLLLILL